MNVNSWNLLCVSLWDVFRFVLTDIVCTLRVHNWKTLYFLHIGLFYVRALHLRQFSNHS
jgi:hypothetical protein